MQMPFSRKMLLYLGCVAALATASSCWALEADVVTTEGIRLGPDRIERKEGEVLLSTRAGSGWVETRVALNRLAQVLPRGDETAERLVPWLPWLELEVLEGVLNEARAARQSETPAVRLSLLRSLRQNWPSNHEGLRSLLEWEGDLVSSLGWADHARALVETWCAAPQERRPSAWGWWKRAEAEWAAGRIEEAAWAAASGVGAISSGSAPGLAECHAYLFACETRLGHADRAEPIAEALRQLGQELPRLPPLLPWLPGNESPPKEPETPTVSDLAAKEGRSLESIRRFRPTVLLPPLP